MRTKINDNAKGGLINVESDCWDQNIESPVITPDLIKLTRKPKLDPK